MNLNQPPAFNGYEHGSDFQRARTQIATPFQYLDIDLTNAKVNVPVEIAGDFLYFDTANGYDGIITFELNNDHAAPMAPFTGRPGFALNALFKKLKCSWSAQPGKKVRLLYSTGERVIPALAANLTVNGTVNTIEAGFTAGANYKSIASLAANTPDAVFLPAANINGAIVWEAELTNTPAVATGLMYSTLLAKTSAPANIIDGNIIASNYCFYNTTSNTVTFNKKNPSRPITIPAGQGLYRISNVAEGGTLSWVSYTLL